MRYIEASTARHYNDLKSIFSGYQKYINIDLTFQDFQNELDSLPGKYAPPDGAVLLAYENEQCIGCVALRPLSEKICEMKRLFVRTGFQGRKIGRELSRRIIKKAIEAGYLKMRLDTLDTMLPAIKIYKRIGFKEIEAYYHNPIPNTIYFEYDLKKGIPDFT